MDIVSIADDIPQTIKDRVNTVRAGLQAGTYEIWKGPIAGQDGSLILADGVVGDDKFLSGINFYFKGVEGNVPGAAN